MTIKELIESGKGYLELNNNKIDLANPQFADLMKWNEGIANGYIKDEIAYSQNGTELVWKWVSLEDDVIELEVVEETEDVIVAKMPDGEICEIDKEAIIEQVEVEDIKKGKDKTK